MSIISDIASQISPTVQSDTTTGSDSLGKEDFLKLLVAQMQQQDPLNPQDPTEFTSQLTQYSNLEQLMSVNSNLESMSDQQSLNSLASAASYIGRDATMLGDGITIDTAGEDSTIEFELPRDAEEVSVSVYDTNGKLIRTLDVGAQDAGTVTYTWDGQTKSGSDAAVGDYYYEVTAKDSAGKDLTAIPHVHGTVTGISYSNGETLLEVDGQKWPLDYLLSVSG